MAYTLKKRPSANGASTKLVRKKSAVIYICIWSTFNNKIALNNKVYRSFFDQFFTTNDENPIMAMSPSRVVILNRISITNDENPRHATFFLVWSVFYQFLLTNDESLILATFVPLWSFFNQLLLANNENPLLASFLLWSFL